MNTVNVIQLTVHFTHILTLKTWTKKLNPQKAELTKPCLLGFYSQHLSASIIFPLNRGILWWPFPYSENTKGSLSFSIKCAPS